jgi:hypothetical protein
VTATRIRRVYALYVTPPTGLTIDTLDTILLVTIRGIGQDPHKVSAV